MNKDEAQNIEQAVALSECLDVFFYDLRKLLILSIDICDYVKKMHEEKVSLKCLSLDSLVVDAKNHKLIIRRNIESSDGVALSDYLYQIGLIMFELLTSKKALFCEDGVAMLDFSSNKNIPKVVQEIVEKLLNNASDLRYRSIAGLKWDLSLCYEQLNTQNRIQYFFVGQKDIPDKLIFGDYLFGRDSQNACLNEAYKGGSSTDLFIVKGCAGTGKTALISNYFKNALVGDGVFICGKPDQYMQMPYAAIIQVLEDYIDKLDNEDDLRKILLEKVGENISILLELIPKIGPIVGLEREPFELDITRSKNRMLEALLQLIESITPDNEPLVIFVDDLHWVDRLSLDVIDRIVKYCDNTIVVCAYREDELVDPYIVDFISRLMKSFNFKEILLENLGISDIEDMVLYYFKVDSESVGLFSKLIFQKTQGNPFFVKQILEKMVGDGHIFYDSSKGWHWDVKQLESVKITDNVGYLVAERLGLLSSETQEIIKYAAFLGNVFSLELLAIILNRQEEEVLLHLYSAVKDNNYIAKTCNNDNKYMFMHDRIQKAAYQMVPIEEQPLIHYKIANILQDKYRNSLYDYSYEIANHINQGLSVMNSKDEEIRVVEINLMAGLRAKNEGAFDDALKYLKTAKKILGSNAWSENYELAYKTNLGLAECQFINGHYDVAETTFDEVFCSAKSFIEKAKICRKQIIFMTYIGRPLDAVQVGISLLIKNKIKVKFSPSVFRIIVNYLMVRWRMFLLKDKVWFLKEIDDLSVTAKLNLFDALVTPGCQVNKKMMSFNVLKSILFTLKHGHMRLTCILFAHLGVIAAHVFKNYVYAKQIWEISWSYFDEHTNKMEASDLYFLYGCYYVPWYRPVKESYSYLLNAYDMGLKTGDILHSSFSIGTYFINRYVSGECLLDIYNDAAKWLVKLERLKEKAGINVVNIIRLNVQILRNNTCDQMDVIINDLNRESMKLPLFVYHAFMLQVSYINDNILAVAEHEEQLQLYVEDGMGLMAYVEYRFFQALIYADRFRNSNNKKFYKKIKDTIKWFSGLTLVNMTNYAHKLLFLQAVLQEIDSKDDGEICALYEKTIDVANKAGCVQIAALAAERLFRYMDNVDAKYSQRVLKKSVEYYGVWGADYKTKKLASMLSS